jgi:glycosyltransferase involved in cell wall biosynthesis
MGSNNLPLLTVICTSYNHENFITKCLDGFVMQQTNFSFEVIVHDDASTDNTVQIVREYESKYPYLFNNIYQKENQYSKNEVNIWSHIMFPKARGKYIAICEGDDYWTDPLKLQKQVDFLEANSEFGLCHTDYSRYIQTTQKSLYHGIQPRTIDVFYGLIKAEYPIGTLTTVFRNEIWKDYINDVDLENRNWLMGDLPFWMYLSRAHKVHYIDDITAVYRVIEESASNTHEIDKMIRFDESVKEVKLFFLEKYATDYTNINKIKREVEAIYIYRKIIAYAKCNGNLNNFFYLLFQFHKINREPRHFFGSFKQIFARLF